MTLDELALACLSHFESEEARLRDNLDALHAVRCALLQRDVTVLSAALEQLNEVANGLARLNEPRIKLRRQIAAALGSPNETATVSELAAHVSKDVSIQLTGRTDTLTELAREVNRAQRDNAFLSHQMLQFLNGVLAQLTHSESAGNRYGVHGQLHGSRAGSTYQARC